MCSFFFIASVDTHIKYLNVNAGLKGELENIRHWKFKNIVMRNSKRYK